MSGNSEEQETLVEIFCHLCDTLLAIAGFKGRQRRSKSTIFLCSFCAQGDASQFKRPPEDDLIIASIKHRAKAKLTDQEQEHIDKYGLRDETGDRYKLLLACHEAKMKFEGAPKGSNEEIFFSLLKMMAPRGAFKNS